MPDYEDLILQRQEIMEIAEDEDLDVCLWGEDLDVWLWGES